MRQRTQSSAPLLAALLLAPAVATGDPVSDRIETGRTLYDEHCAVCHGAELEGAPDWRRPGQDGRFPAPPHDETGHTWHHGDAMLFDYVQRGGQSVLDDMGVEFDSGMPAFGETLTNAQIEAVLAFIRSTWPEEIREMQSERTEREQSD